MASGTAVLKTFRFSHLVMIDMILAEPKISNIELARRLKFTPEWVSRLRSSDSFNARLWQRKQELADPELVATVNSRLKSVTLQALDKVQSSLAVTDSPAMALEALTIVADIARTAKEA